MNTLKDKQITHYAWAEPDCYAVDRLFGGQALTAIAAGPVEPAQRYLFRDLEKVSYREGGSVSPQVKSQLPDHFPVAQLQSGPTLNQEDAGVSPAGEANLHVCP